MHLWCVMTFSYICLKCWRQGKFKRNFPRYPSSCRVHLCTFFENLSQTSCITTRWIEYGCISICITYHVHRFHISWWWQTFFTRWCEIVKSRCFNQLQLRCLESFHNRVCNSMNFPPFYLFFSYFSLHQLLTRLQLKVYYEELARKPTG